LSGRISGVSRGAPRIVPRTQWFRANTGIVVSDGTGQVLQLQREQEGAWQFPQGGLDYDQEPYDSALRELQEETGLTADYVERIAEMDEWLAYVLDEPTDKHGLGQVQKWYLLRLTGHEGDVQPHLPEFVAKRWVTMDEAIADAWERRRPIYARLAESWKHYLTAELSR
jgi:putative (di)nucleoside polyphosphate hydrolase